MENSEKNKIEQIIKIRKQANAFYLKTFRL
jgi:hypothetical protein